MLTSEDPNTIRCGFVCRWYLDLTMEMHSACLVIFLARGVIPLSWPSVYLACPVCILNDPYAPYTAVQSAASSGMLLMLRTGGAASVLDSHPLFSAPVICILLHRRIIQPPATYGGLASRPPSQLAPSPNDQCPCSVVSDGCRSVPQAARRVVAGNRETEA